MLNLMKEDNSGEQNTLFCFRRQTVSWRTAERGRGREASAVKGRPGSHTGGMWCQGAPGLVWGAALWCALRDTLPFVLHPRPRDLLQWGQLHPDRFRNLWKFPRRTNACCEQVGLQEGLEPGCGAHVELSLLPDALEGAHTGGHRSAVPSLRESSGRCAPSPQGTWAIWVVLQGPQTRLLQIQRGAMTPATATAPRARATPPRVQGSRRRRAGVLPHSSSFPEPRTLNRPRQTRPPWALGPRTPS